MLRMRAVLCKREPALILGHAEACARPPACVYIGGMQKPFGPNPAPAPALACEVCILAGGLSSRMGRNKAALRLGGRTLLARIRALAKPLSLPVRVIRIDLIPGCGPLGGIQTALATSRAAGSLFLSCDMPFVSTDLLRRILRGAGARTPALFVWEAKEFGFPFLLRRSCLPIVERQLGRNQLSLQALARALRAKTLRSRRGQGWELFNVNTPAEWRQARQLWRAPGKHGLSLPAGACIVAVC